MREIKFRMWDGETKKYFYDKSCNDCLRQQMNGMYNHISNGSVFEQSINVHDTNGTPIYEGDLVRYKTLVDSEYHEKGGVGEDEVSFSYGRFYIKGYASILDWADMELEVVGDIHRGHIIPHPEKGTIQ